MMFKGISLGQFGWLFAGMAGALLLIYILRYRRRGKTISNFIIWKRVVGAKRSIWSEILAFLLHLAILGLVAFALTDPSPAQSSVHRRFVAVVVDGSLSMGAKSGEGKTRMDLAAEKAWELLENNIRRIDRAMIVLAASEVKALTGFSNNDDVLKAALEGMKPEGRAPKISMAVEYAKNAFSFLDLSENDSLHLYLFTDRPEDVIPPPAPGVDVKVIGVGLPSQNTGIVAFDVRKPFNLTGGHELMVRVANFGDAKSEVKMIVYTPKATVGKENLTLAPGQERTEHYYLPFGVQGKVTALLSEIKYESGADSLVADNGAFAYINPQKKTRVLLVSIGNLFLEKALALNPQISLTKTNPQEYSQGKSFGFDTVIFDDFTPPKPPSAHAIYIHPTGSPFKVVKKVKKPAMTGWADQHPVLRYIKLNDLNIKEGNPIVLEKGDTVLAEYHKNALIMTREKGGRKILGIGFSLKKSDLPLRIAFPIFFHNAIMWFAESNDVEKRATHQIGEILQLPVKGDATQVEMITPLKQKIILHPQSGFFSYSPPTPGFYSYSDTKGQKIVAVSLIDPDESDLSNARSDPVTPLNAVSHSRGVEKFWPFLILLVFGLVIFDFWLYNNGKLP